MNKITIGLKKGLAVIVGEAFYDNKILVSNVNHHLMQFGYILSEEAFMMLSELNEEDILIWEKEAITFYQSYLGDGNAKTLSDLILDGDLFDSHWSLLSRYWLNQEWEPEIPNNYNFETKDLKVLKFAEEAMFRNIFTKLIRVNSALTPADFEIIEWFVDNYDAKELPMPAEIPFKENLCMLASKCLKVPVKTATDVLRIGAYMSGLGSDLILPPKKIKADGWSREWIPNPEYKTHKFRKFSNKEKRFLLGLLENVANVSEMKTREGRWLRLLHMLNPNKYKESFPKAAKAAYLIQNQSTKKQLSKFKVKNGYERNNKVVTWKGRLDRAYKEDFLKGLEVHKEKAGEFARSLDALLRNNLGYSTYILRAFKEVANKISNKVLFELYTHFEKRTKTYIRKIFVPGARRSTELPSLEPMSEDFVNDIKETIWSVLFEKFKTLEPLGKVWLDERLKDIPLPTNMRSLGDSLDIVIRGTRVPFDKDIKILNAYMYWTAGVDLDISATFLNPDTNQKTVCSYSNMNPFRGVVHSGDIIPNIPGEYAEYIGINIEKTLDLGFRYALITAHNFKGGSLNDVGGLTGFQEVFELRASKRWLPENVSGAMKLVSETSTTALILFDLQEKDWIMVDTDLNQIPLSSGEEFTNYILALSEPPKVSAWTLLKMQADARGSIVSEVEDADTVFKYEDFNTSYEDIIRYML